ncbi:bacteriorhodopsin [Candidatus Uabimicrobium amorphum]|uniref:Xanthorhodopsin n=1 Tax=Uabimicrobium amorphum TaxID=2596890 RepID=A0A5S9IPH6_UABAM|nr:bacteriorhodopsin [Candidatus Uabimicrobium amorphum]BBM85311.1 xanthorhodopsin [Candidatus Uabimicrobium amorphum]
MSFFLAFSDVITEATVLQELVKYTFFVGYIAMGTAFVFFLAERGNVLPEYRRTVTLSALVVGVAAFHYYAMKNTYVPGQTFPTEFRYIDWIITTPLMLIKFPAMLGIRQGAKSLIYKLVAFDVAMILLGYIGEVTTGTLQWAMFGSSCLCWLAIVGVLLTTVKSEASSSSPEIQSGINSLIAFVTIGWAIYPIGFAVRYISDSPVALDGVQLVYNIGDAINKIGFGLVAYSAALAVTHAKQSKEA